MKNTIGFGSSQLNSNMVGVRKEISIRSNGSTQNMGAKKGFPVSVMPLNFRKMVQPGEKVSDEREKYGQGLPRAFEKV